MIIYFIKRKTTKSALIRFAIKQSRVQVHSKNRVKGVWFLAAQHVTHIYISMYVFSKIHSYNDWGKSI